MEMRNIKRQVQGKAAMDGAGVHLVRVLGIKTTEDFDPFLMLDSFDSTNPDDYTAGFPFHPHRGIETFTYLAKGDIEHQDSMKNKGSILDGEAQWMTAGSGIMHQEMPRPSDHMLGLQLWVNLPQKDKMAKPAYNSLTREDIPEVPISGGLVRVLAGEYRDGQGNITKGFESQYVKTTAYDITLEPGQELVIPNKPGETVFIFTLVNGIEAAGEIIASKTAVLFGDGDAISLVGAPEGSRFTYYAAMPLHEPIAWGGPIVMNSNKELADAFGDLESGTFIRDEVYI